jgi:2-polyprenyl-3-methyl-5-hydroxy-6-metoxy-1,4-benzoquinol methylase
MLNEPISKRYLSDGKENFQLTSVQIAARDSISKKLDSGDYSVATVNCPLCEGNKNRSLSEKDTYGLPVKVVVCSECGLVYNNPRLTEVSLPAFYGEDYRELDRVLPGVEAYYQLENTKGKRIFQFLSKNALLPQISGKTVIDIGCGAGGVLGHFQQAGYDILGCDLVPAHLEYGRKEKHLDLHYGSLQTIEKLKTERGIDIGLVIYEQVFEHLPDPNLELQRLHQMMMPGSLLYVGVPGLRNIDEQYNSDFLRFLQLPHLAHFDLEHLIALMRKNGFQFIAGNEIVQSIFAKSTAIESQQLPRYESTAQFIAGLERRRERKEKIALIRSFPSRTSTRLKSWLENSPLPTPIKAGLIRFLKKVKYFIKA